MHSVWRSSSLCHDTARLMLLIDLDLGLITGSLNATSEFLLVVREGSDPDDLYKQHLITTPVCFFFLRQLFSALLNNC